MQRPSLDVERRSEPFHPRVEQARELVIGQNPKGPLAGATSICAMSKPNLVASPINVSNDAARGPYSRDAGKTRMAKSRLTPGHRRRDDAMRFLGDRRHVAQGRDHPENLGLGVLGGDKEAQAAAPVLGDADLHDRRT